MLDSNPRGPEEAKIALSNKSEALPGRREDSMSYNNAYRAWSSGKASLFITGALIDKGLHQQFRVSAKGSVVYLVLLLCKLANSMAVHEQNADLQDARLLSPYAGVQKNDEPVFFDSTC